MSLATQIWCTQQMLFFCPVTVCILLTINFFIFYSNIKQEKALTPVDPKTKLPKRHSLITITGNTLTLPYKAKAMGCSGGGNHFF
jgi:hypothetical protein